MVKYFCITICFLLGFLFYSCNTSSGNVAQETIEFSANHQDLKFLVSFEDDAINVKDKNNINYHLEHVQSGSGAKYSDGTHEFWIKGDDFIWSVNGKKICNGSISISEDQLIGDYASVKYKNRKEGYDWTGVRVSKFDDEKLNIKVRSRSDKKKPTCTLDVLAYKTKNGVYHAFVNGGKVLFKFHENSLDITSEKPDLMRFYCSGGGSFLNTYQKQNKPLDPKQVDQRTYAHYAEYMNIGFDISAITKKGKQEVIIQTLGLAHDDKITIPFEGTIVHTYVEDLDLDMSPDVVIVGRDKNKEGVLVAFSTNNKKSISQVTFNSIKEDAGLSEGYQGNDDFAIVETTLVQRFPFYENGKTAGKMKQIQYKLKHGEASKKFEVDRVIEF
ncbi:MliC family protein [Flammeovirga yaeyamensis]|uniref:MliC family protein n=1 Tax=Flammeovirga yaeyamensis TaxID=367791 RepID=A0AAX1NBN1_9BACT|nr:MliC family protein [Flammeovirga yaeyamensis]MBB3697098.1 membrane-bound inhibitor of C-type lysozyme [Flammeovirga yaeyamensis]NMF33760.1 hypothetical protein [Flammeovirga yaeyamensis]QWG04974.1 MliC family protein [Flammeovirga yaeyamensis]